MSEKDDQAENEEDEEVVDEKLPLPRYFNDLFDEFSELQEFDL